MTPFVANVTKTMQRWLQRRLLFSDVKRQSVYR